MVARYGVVGAKPTDAGEAFKIFEKINENLQFLIILMEILQFFHNSFKFYQIFPRIFVKNFKKIWEYTFVWGSGAERA